MSGWDLGYSNEEILGNDYSEIDSVSQAIDEYYAVEEKIVMVPVKVKVYRNIGMIQSFEKITQKQIENLMKGDFI